MKRYKDCSLLCNKTQTPDDLLGIIFQISENAGYKVDRYSSLGNNDTLAVYIRVKGLIYSRLILCAKKNSVAIVNIVPMQESGVSHIKEDEYNKLLNYFRDDVFKTIQSMYDNVIHENSEDYTLSDIIPLSYPILEKWLNNFPLSGHPLDEERWFDFVIALHNNKEYLPRTDFEKYIEEEYEWDSSDIEDFALKLESQLELLEYYDGRRKI